MRIKEVRELITSAVLAERERCAGIADRRSTELHRAYKIGNGPLRGDSYTEGGSDVANSIAQEIRSANPPSIKVIRPETAKLHPEQVTYETIVAGQGLVGDEIVDRKRIDFKACPDRYRGDGFESCAGEP